MKLGRRKYAFSIGAFVSVGAVTTAMAAMLGYSVIVSVGVGVLAGVALAVEEDR